MKSCWCGNKKLNEYSTGYFLCDKCNTLISKFDFDKEIYDVKDEEQDLYGKNYWEETMTKVAQKETLSQVVDMYLTERVIYWLKYVLKYTKLGGDVAEVGCGLGQLQYVLKRIGYKQKAFELSQEICDYMKMQLDVDVHCGPFEKNNGIYDAIMAFDLFEHLVQPIEFIDYCSESLRPGGVLFMQTPCYNPTLSYSEMKKKVARFEEQLKQDQHVYLYSKESISNLLQEKGYKNIMFQPAFFGDDYDMFLLASKEPFHENSDKEIDGYLNNVPNGRLVKAMVTLFDEKEQATKEAKAIDNERNKIIEDVEFLTRKVKDDEIRIKEYAEAAANRLEAIEKLQASMEILRKENEVLKKAADERLLDVEKLQKENNDVQFEAAERLDSINKLVERNGILQQVADERLNIINILESQKQELQQAADKRLDIINHLSEENKMLMEAARERLRIIEELTK